jgi:hypothetical protein
VPIISKSGSLNFLEHSESVQDCHRDCKIAEAIFRENTYIINVYFVYKTVDVNVYNKIKIMVPAVKT